MTEIERFEAKFTKGDGCWNWHASLATGGYGHFWLRGRPRPASQASYMLYKGEIEGGLFVLHACDNRKCVNPDHLFLGTVQDNTADMVSKGRQVKGSASKNAKLTEVQVRAIREDSRSQRQIGAAYGVSHTTIGQIKSRELWRHA